ncbi:MAG: hypothetical protein WDN47_01580 [Candidatus Doudnabacteria bacterium]
MKNRFENRGEIVGASVPDEDMHGWINSLMEGGFSQEEIDRILVHLNQTYAKQKGIKKPQKKDFLEAAKELGFDPEEFDI